MTQPEELARHLLLVEQQLKAYQRLHAEEFEELWRTLNECKQAIADGLCPGEPPALTPKRELDSDQMDPKTSAR